MFLFPLILSKEPKVGYIDLLFKIYNEILIPKHGYQSSYTHVVRQRVSCWLMLLFFSFLHTTKKKTTSVCRDMCEFIDETLKRATYFDLHLNKMVVVRTKAGGDDGDGDGEETKETES